MIFGKLVAGMLGFFVAGPFGAVIGVVVGHFFDRGLGGTLGGVSPQQIEQIRESYFQTIFTLMGQLAKSDGRISASEIAQAEQTMAHMGMDGEHRQRAIEFFKTGSASVFDTAQILEEFKRLCGSHHKLKHSLLVYLISLALADGEIHTAERSLLLDIALSLGFKKYEFDRLIEMIEAQHRFAGSAEQDSGLDIGAAYKALGVAPDCSDTALKRAYRKLMSQHHPDKLIAQGVPDEMLKVATEKAQEIQAAYELIKKHRK